MTTAMNWTVLDIETAPQARALAMPYPKAEREPPKNYVKPEAIEGWYARDEAAWRTEWAKTCALSPRLGRVVSVSTWVGDVVWNLTNLEETIERELIADAIQSIASSRRLVTFNGLGFDVPFLHVRAAILGVRIPYQTGDYLRRYTTTPHADLCAILANWAYGKSGDTLHGWCEAFGIPCPDPTTGADVGGMVERGDAEGIRQHGHHDVTATHALATKLDAAGLL